MSQDALDTERTVNLLISDAVATLGEAARIHVLRVAEVMEMNAGFWLENGHSIAETQLSFDREVVDHFQQDVHDSHWDNTWPACPRHPRHPLWYREEKDAWCCPRDEAPLAPLGGLADLRR